jgi:hypothetical protein
MIEKKICELREFMIGVFLSSWQRNLTWSMEAAEALYDTIIKKMYHEYCKIDPIKLGRYSESNTETGLVYELNYMNPVKGTKHRKIGSRDLKHIKHLQDGQQRLTCILFMLFGDIWTEGGKKYYLYFNLQNNEIVFDPRNRTVIMDQGITTMVKTSKIFEIFMSDVDTTIKIQQCHDLRFSYDDVKDLVDHVLNYIIRFEIEEFESKTQALDYFRRQNSGMPLTHYELFINYLIEYIGDYEFDQYFEDATNELNNALPTPYFKKKKKRVGKEDFALNMMSYRTRQNESYQTLSLYPKESITTGVDNESVNERTINTFKNKLLKYLKKLLNTKIEVESSDGLSWETIFPYKSLFTSYRLPMLSLVRQMGNGIDARTNDALPKQAIRFLLHLICTGHSSHSKHTPESRELFAMNHLDELREKELSVDLDQVPIDTKIFLVATSVDVNYKLHPIFSSISKSLFNKTWRSEESLTDVDMNEVEILPSDERNTNIEIFLEERKKEINKRMKILLEKYDIRVS